MNKNSILKLAPNVLKRMEMGINIFYLLNLENDEIWQGNYTVYLIVDKMDGKNTVEDIVNILLKEHDVFSYDVLLPATIDVLQDLVEKKYIVVLD